MCLTNPLSFCFKFGKKIKKTPPLYKGGSYPRRKGFPHRLSTLRGYSNRHTARGTVKAWLTLRFRLFLPLFFFRVVLAFLRPHDAHLSDHPHPDQRGYPHPHQTLEYAPHCPVL